LALFRFNAVQSIRAGGDEAVTEIIAGCLQFDEAFGLTFPFTALSDRNINKIHARFAKYAERQSADDRFVVGMGSEEEGFGSAFGNLRAGSGWEGAERMRFRLLEQANALGNKFVIRVHNKSF